VTGERHETYTDPVLDADRSAPDVVRFGDDFHLTASGFGLFAVAPPGTGHVGDATFGEFRIGPL
jgi:hypothetical protein